MQQQQYTLNPLARPGVILVEFDATHNLPVLCEQNYHDAEQLAQCVELAIYAAELLAQSSTRAVDPLSLI